MGFALGVGEGVCAGRAVVDGCVLGARVFTGGSTARTGFSRRIRRGDFSGLAGFGVTCGEGVGDGAGGAGVGFALGAGEGVCAGGTEGDGCGFEGRVSAGDGIASAGVGDGDTRWKGAAASCAKTTAEIESALAAVRKNLAMRFIFLKENGALAAS